MSRRRNKGQITDDPKTWQKARTAADYKDIYTRWHWSVPPDEVVNWPDPDVPNKMIEIGRLWEMHVVPVGKSNPKKIIEVRDKIKNDNYLAFDPHAPNQDLHLLLSKGARAAAKQQLWDNYDVKPESLAVWAKRAGGRHAHRKYPSVIVKPVGTFTDVVYRCWKKGDDDASRGSSYIHRMGEEGSVEPILTVDAKGRCWIAGGGYTAPVPGITG